MERVSNLLEEASHLLRSHQSRVEISSTIQRSQSAEGSGSTGTPLRVVGSGGSGPSRTESLILPGPSPFSPLLQNFRPRPPEKRGRSTRRSNPYERKTTASLTWTHKFVALADCGQDDVPTAQQKYELKNADLGEQKIVFRLSGSYSHMKEKVLECYPRLQAGGGIEFLRTGGPYSRQLVVIDAKYLQSVAKLKSFIDQARVYVRPVQSSIVLVEKDDKNTKDDDDYADDVEEKCLTCGKMVKLSFLRTHVEVCRESKQLYEEGMSAAEDDVPALPPPLRMATGDSSTSRSTATFTSPSFTGGSSGGCRSRISLEGTLPSGYVEYISLLDDDDVSDAEESDMQSAIAASLTESNPEHRFGDQSGSPSLAELLKEHTAANLPLSVEDTLYQLITVSRRKVWSDVKRAFTKPYTNLDLPIRVIFSGEEAADDGGPRREFFRLALGAATSDPALFSGPPSLKFPVHNTSAILEKCFLHVGKLVAMSLTQGGTGPACFCPWVYDYLTLGFDGVKVAVHDIPDITIQDKLKLLLNANTDEQLRDQLASDDYDFVLDCGYMTPIAKVKVSNIPAIIKMVSVNLTIVSVKSELDQLAEGLRLFKVLELLKSYPGTFRSLFVHDPLCKLTAEEMIMLFHPQFSTPGSSRRVIEDDLIQNWNEFLQDVSHGIIKSPVCSGEGEDREVLLSLGDILTFVTGASCVPPMGFDSPPQINFCHEDAHFPTASTCVPSITIPQSMREMSVFVTRMTEAIIGAIGFGKV